MPVSGLAASGETSIEGYNSTGTSGMVRQTDGNNMLVPHSHTQDPFANGQPDIAD